MNFERSLENFKKLQENSSIATGNPQKQLIILVGSQGSGKSTLTKNRYPDAIVASADHHMVDNKTGKYVFDKKKLGFAHTMSKKTANDGMAKGHHTIVVDNTNTSMRDAKDYVEMAKKHGYKVKFVHTHAPLEQMIKRQLHNVPADIVKKYRENAERFAAELPKLGYEVEKVDTSEK